MKESEFNSRKKLTQLWEAYWTNGLQLMKRKFILVWLGNLFLLIQSWTTHRPSHSPHTSQSSRETLIQMSAQCKKAIWRNTTISSGIMPWVVRSILLSVCITKRYQKAGRETQPPFFIIKKWNWHLEDFLLSHLNHDCWGVKLDCYFSTLTGSFFSMSNSSFKTHAKWIQNETRNPAVKIGEKSLYLLCENYSILGKKNRNNIEIITLPLRKMFLSGSAFNK